MVLDERVLQKQFSIVLGSHTIFFSLSENMRTACARASCNLVALWL